MGSFFGKSVDRTTTIPPTENYETFSLLWLHTSVTEIRQIETELRSTINHIRSFKQSDECEQYIRNVPDNRIVLIISGELGKELVPRIHQLTQVSSIYIYCTDYEEHQKWTKEITKVRAISSSLNDLTTQIKTERNRRQKIDEPLSINIFKMNVNDQRSSTDISGAFLHSQLFMDALLRMIPSPTDMNELIALCSKAFEDNRFKLKFLTKFQSEYSSEQALDWYTQESFLYQILNQALRTENVELLFLFRFFIRDIEEQLKCLHAQQSSIPVRTYRGQLMRIVELFDLTCSVGDLVSMNSFLSTSLDRERVLFLLDSVLEETDLARVMFQIDADPRLSGIKPFANISEKSHMPDEIEVLFLFGSIFRVTRIDWHDDIYIIEMVLCSDVDDEFKTLFQHKQQLNSSMSSVIAPFVLGGVLTNSGKFKQAEFFYRRMLKEVTDDRMISICYKALELITGLQDKGDESAIWRKKALDMEERILSQTPLNTAKVPINRAQQQARREEYTEALHSYTEALIIYKEQHGEEHETVANCLEHIGNIYKELEQYHEALEFLQKAFHMFEHLPSDNCLALASCHSTISEVYTCLNQFECALQHAQQSLGIRRERSLPDPQLVGLSYRNLAFVNMGMGDFRKALLHLKKAATIFRLCLSPTQPIVCINDEEIKDVESLLQNVDDSPATN